MWMTLLYITRLGISQLQLVGLWELRSRHLPSSSCWATSPSIHVLCQLSTAHSLQVRCGACYIFRSSSFFVHISFCVTYYCITSTESDSFIITPVQCILYSLKLKCIYHALHLACFIGVKVCYIEPHQGKWKFNPNHGPWKVKVKFSRFASESLLHPTPPGGSYDCCSDKEIEEREPPLQVSAKIWRQATRATGPRQQTHEIQSFPEKTGWSRQACSSHHQIICYLDMLLIWQTQPIYK